MAMIRTITFSGLIDDLKGSATGWKSKAEEQIKRSAENLAKENEGSIKRLIDQADKKAKEIAEKASKTAAEEHAKTITREAKTALQPYLIGGAVLLTTVGALAAYAIVRK